MGKEEIRKNQQTKKRHKKKYILIGIVVLLINLYFIISFFANSFNSNNNKVVDTNNSSKVDKDEEGNNELGDYEEKKKITPDSENSNDGSSEDNSNKNDRIVSVSPTTDEDLQVAGSIVDPDISIDEGSFKLEAKYMREESEEIGDWQYTISGFLPTPCNSATVEPLIMESFPEQVVINLKINDNSDEGQLCVQVLQEYKYSSSIESISKNADWKLNIER